MEQIILLKNLNQKLSKFSCLVKVSKPFQIFKVDLPTIGPTNYKKYD